jgi:hypothetical protein
VTHAPPRPIKNSVVITHWDLVRIGPRTRTLVHTGSGLDHDDSLCGVVDEVQAHLRVEVVSVGGVRLLQDLGHFGQAWNHLCELLFGDLLLPGDGS